MSHNSTGGRRGIAAALLLGLLLTGSACGSQQDTASDLGNALPENPSSSTSQGQSPRALKADADRAAQGELPPSPQSSPGKRIPDTLP